jgi:hypothetical protein
MLIWKVIAANPGINRQGIWERIEHDIPAGFAMRRFPSKVDRSASRSTLSPLRVARRRLLNETLLSMEKHGHVVSDSCAIDRPFKAAREPHYRGNPEMIDETGTKAAEHMALADALRTAEKWLAGADLNRPLARNGARPPVLGPPNRKVYDALMMVVQALRAKGSQADH